MELAWPFRVVLIWGKRSGLLYPWTDSHSPGCPQDQTMRLCGRKGESIPRICLLEARLNHPSLGLKGYSRLNLLQSVWVIVSGCVVSGCYWHVGHSAAAVDRLVLVTSTPAVLVSSCIHCVSPEVVKRDQLMPAG